MKNIFEMSRDVDYDIVNKAFPIYFGIEAHETLNAP